MSKAQLADYANTKEMLEEIDDLTIECDRLRDQLEEMADLAAFHGLCHNIPAAKRAWVEGRR